MGYRLKMGSRVVAATSPRNSRLGAACVMVVLCWLSICSPAAAESASAKLARLPLWSALPTRHFIELGGESTSRYRWEAFAFRSPRSMDPRKVCVASVSARVDRGVLSYSSGSPDCGPVGKTIKMPVLFEEGLGEPTRSAMVVITGTEAVKVSVSTDLGSVLDASLRPVEGSRARKGRVTAFRYALLVPRQEVTIRQVIGLGSSGAAEFETPNSPSGVSERRL
jgi:hypothetical protein